MSRIAVNAGYEVAMAQLTEQQRRLEFKKIVESEARKGPNKTGIQFDIINLKEVFADVQLDLNKAVRNLPARVSIRLANDIKGGKSAWRVRPGYSRSRFKGDERGIVNDASYSPFLERTDGAAADYVNRNVRRIAEEVLEAAIDA